LEYGAEENDWIIPDSDETEEGESEKALPEVLEEADEHAEHGISVYDPLHRYLMEIRKYPFLSEKEERQLALLSRSEDRDETTLQAITRLILSHLRLVASIAMEYKSLPFDTMDLIQEGNIGLMQAIKKFDPHRNVRVATYATWWIRAYILRHIIQNWRLVRIGTTEAQRKLFFRLSKERERLEKQGYLVGPKLLADHLHVKEGEVIDVEQRLAWGQEVSLSDPVGLGGDTGEEGSPTLGDRIPSGEEAIDQRLARKQLALLFQSKLKQFSETLNLRDRDILTNRILSETPLTLEALGVRYTISKERVRQLEGNLIKKIKQFVREEITDFEEES
jgi:RNA polymerase sigma-32 factor